MKPSLLPDQLMNLARQRSVLCSREARLHDKMEDLFERSPQVRRFLAYQRKQKSIQIEMEISERRIASAVERLIEEAGA